MIASVPVLADQTEDEAAIRKVVDQVYAAINKHDAKALAALCTEKSENWEGDVKGRAAIETVYSSIFANMKDVQIRPLDEIGIVFVTNDVAIYKHNDEITGSLDEDGKPLPPYKRLSAKVFVKKNGKWLFAAHFYRTIEEQ